MRKSSVQESKDPERSEKRVLTTGAAAREEVAIPHNGKSYAFDMTIEPLFDADGKVVGITGACMDIARLREIADRLQDAKEKLAQEKSYLESEIQTELGFEEIIGQSPAAAHGAEEGAGRGAHRFYRLDCWGRPAPGKNWWHALSIPEFAARSRHSSNSIAPPCPRVCWRANSSATRKEPSPAPSARKLGRIELADKGTLFLDEIGELPLELQPKLLRVLQDREFERLGGVRTLHVDVRIIAATNRDLRQDIADKKFREDLFYRLNVFPIELAAIARPSRTIFRFWSITLFDKHCGAWVRRIDTIPTKPCRCSQNWNWPGNIRELENMIERMVILTKRPSARRPPG